MYSQYEIYTQHTFTHRILGSSSVANVEYVRFARLDRPIHKQSQSHRTISAHIAV